MQPPRSNFLSYMVGYRGRGGKGPGQLTAHHCHSRLGFWTSSPTWAEKNVCRWQVVQACQRSQPRFDNGMPQAHHRGQPPPPRPETGNPRPTVHTVACFHHCLFGRKANKWAITGMMHVCPPPATASNRQMAGENAWGAEPRFPLTSNDPEHDVCPGSEALSPDSISKGRAWEGDAQVLGRRQCVRCCWLGPAVRPFSGINQSTERATQKGECPGPHVCASSCPGIHPTLLPTAPKTERHACVRVCGGWGHTTTSEEERKRDQGMKVIR